MDEDELSGAAASPHPAGDGDVHPPGDRWSERRATALLIRTAVVVVPVIVSIVICWVLFSVVPQAGSTLAAAARWVVIVALAALGLVLSQVLMKRLLPLAGLFSLTLIFPDQAPSRFAVAYRSSVRPRQESGRSERLSMAQSADRALELVRELSHHDSLNRGHAERVRAYALLIADEMDMSTAERDRLEWAALLHDVGKLGVEADALAREGPLTAEEFDDIRRHPEVGREMVRPILPWLGSAANGIWEHHEHYDGGGYPTGVAASGLSIEGRIIAVAEAYDAMTAQQTYRRTISPAAARQEIQSVAGTQFDPRVVRALMSVSLGRLFRVSGPLAALAALAWLPRQVANPGPASSTAVAGVTSSVASVALVGVLGLPAGVEEPPPAVPFAVPAPTTSVAPTTVVLPPPIEAPPPETTAPRTTVAPTTIPSTTIAAPTTLPPTTVPPTNAPTTLPPSTRPPTTLPPTTVPPVVTTTQAPITTPPTTLPPTTVPPTTLPPTSAPPTTLPPTTTTLLPTTTLPPTTTTGPVDLELPITIGVGGDTSSSPVLPLAGGQLFDGPLPNYDSDRNDDPGLTVRRSPLALAANNPDRVQVWTLPADVATAPVAGPVTWTLFVAAVPGSTGERFLVRAGLFDCVDDRSRCRRVSRDEVWLPVSGDGSFVAHPFDLTPESVPYTPEPGRRIELRVGVPPNSEADVALAYGTVEYPSAIIFGN